VLDEAGDGRAALSRRCHNPWLLIINLSADPRQGGMGGVFLCLKRQTDTYDLQRVCKEDRCNASQRSRYKSARGRFAHFGRYDDRTELFVSHELDTSIREDSK
jgi:hypothetical protein